MSTKVSDHPIDIAIRCDWYMLVFGALFVITLILFVATACLGELTTARYIMLTIAGGISAAGAVGNGWYSDAAMTSFNEYKDAEAELEAIERKIRDEESRAALYRAAVRDFGLYVNKGLTFKAGRIFSDYYWTVLRGIDPHCKSKLMELRYGKVGHTNYLKLAIDQLRADYGL